MILECFMGEDKWLNMYFILCNITVHNVSYVNNSSSSYTDTWAIELFERCYDSKSLRIYNGTVSLSEALNPNNGSKSRKSSKSKCVSPSLLIVKFILRVM